MAEGIVHEGKSLEELEKEITCAICHEHYTYPKILPCLHYYCKKCILKLALRTATNQPISCPECRKETTLPEGGVDELKTAFFINRFKSKVSALERVHGKVEVKCEECTDSEDRAEAFCRQCAVFICGECVKSHKRMKSLASHEVVSLEDLKEGRAREIAVKKPPSKNCHIHEEPLGIYCFDCSSLICRDCTVIVHKEHKFEFSKVAAPITKKKLLEDLNPLREVTVNMSSAIEVLQTTKQEVEAQGDSVTNTIHTSFNELQQILEKHKQQLLTEAASKVQEKMDKLLVQEKNLSLANAEVQSIVDYTERFVGHCSDNEVMSMHAEIRRRIEREIEEHSKSGRSMEPVEEADMGVEVRCAEDLQQLCQNKANITRLVYIDPAQCTVMGEGVETAEVHKTAEVTLTANTLTNNKTTRCSSVVVGQLKSLYDGSVIQCDVEQSGPGEHRIQYTPTVRGRHELTVSVDGEQVLDSPVPVFVSIPPTQLGKPVKVWCEIRYPSGVTANSEGDIIVPEFHGDIVKIDKEGKKHILVEHSKCMLHKLIAVAADNEDNIYCTDMISNKIMQCNKNGGNVQVHEVKQVKGPGHRGVIIVRDEVMLCENNNESTIMVYDRELKYVRRIEHGGMGTFWGVCADNHGNLYVTDHTKSRIRVFSNDGVFLRSFGRDGVERLNGPTGLCASGQYVYVTNNSGHNVSVFTTAGDHVTTFGERGNEEGSFFYPYHIFVDHYVFVTDSHNNRIQCF